MLDYGFAQLSYEEDYVRYIHQDFLRNEGNHIVKVELLQLPRNFMYESQMVFIPQSCHWFEEKERSFGESGDAVTHRGEADMVFDLVLVNNPDYACDSLTFYDRFYSIDFQWIVPNSVEYIKNEPVMDWALQDYIDYDGTNLFSIRATLPSEE